MAHALSATACVFERFDFARVGGETQAALFLKVERNLFRSEGINGTSSILRFLHSLRAKFAFVTSYHIVLSLAGHSNLE